MGIRKKKTDTGAEANPDRVPSLYEIEVAIARSEQFNYTRKLVVYNVCGKSSILPIWHECDVLVCTKLGYLTEIEIKRSWSDYLNDYKKDHDHSSSMIKSLYFCVPAKMAAKVEEHISKLPENDWRSNAGVLSVNRWQYGLYISVEKGARENRHAEKLSAEQMFYLARLGSMRVVTLKSKMAKQEAKC